MKILIVEDMQTIILLLKVYIVGWGVEAEFLQAKNGREGLMLAKQHKPDIIITDVAMPEMDGFELCAAIRSDPVLFSRPVFLLTSLDDAASHASGRMVGATAFLHKPIAPEALKQQLLPYLERS